MSCWLKIYYKLINLILTLLVNSQSIPSNPTSKLGIDSSLPIIYVLPLDSKLDLLILRKQCMVYNLPDPLKFNIIDNINLPRYIFIQELYNPTIYINKIKYLKLLYKYIDLHYKNKLNMDLQIVLISITFGRFFKYKKIKLNLISQILSGIKKFFIIIWFGRNNFVNFSSLISLKQILIKYNEDEIIIPRLIRLARIYFIRRYLSLINLSLPSHELFLKKILKLRHINRIVQDEMKNKQTSYNKIRQSILNLIKEISANFSYEAIRIADCVLNLIWNRLYRAINIYNIDYVRELFNSEFEIVYIPCHRSHIDYLLISYILYHQCLIPPHIAAGVNLNFWPVGPVLRRLGAFFIRRTFVGNKLYSLIFSEYLKELFSHRYSIEYFIEGSRSRTGLLLPPKTGILSIAIQSMLSGETRPIILVPIYIGYERIIEINTYARELSGINKKKENFLNVLRSLNNLSNLGQVYISFGKPLSLINWLNRHVPEWRKYTISNHVKNIIHPNWVTPIANDIAINLMTRINETSVINAVNLCCTALLSSSTYSLTRDHLNEQLECYSNLINNVPYSSNIRTSLMTSNNMVDYVLQIHKLEIKNNIFKDIIVIPQEKICLMSYYRNNIVHILILPSLVAIIIVRYKNLFYHELLFFIDILYPLLKTDLFLHWKDEELVNELHKIIQELINQKLIYLNNNELSINISKLHILNILAANANEILQRYFIIFWLSKNTCTNRISLEVNYNKIIKILSLLNNVNISISFDKRSFILLITTLRNNRYIDYKKNKIILYNIKIYKILSKLVTSDIHLIIKNTKLVYVVN